MSIGTQRKIVDRWFGRYIRLRDAEKFHDETGADIEFAQCCTCGRISNWKQMDCGHFVGKGKGGNSGVRYDERNAHCQCKPCNAWSQGNMLKYIQFMLRNYSQLVIDELELKHTIHSYSMIDLMALEIYYKTQYKDLCKRYRLKP